MSKNEPTRSRNPQGTRKTFGTQAPNRSKAAMYWEHISAEELHGLVCQLCDNGFGLVLGRTSDGGALSITVLDGEQRIREYANSAESFTTFKDWCASVLNS